MNQINVVFLSGGTCEIPFIQEKIRSMFPETRLIIDGELATITAKGATVHALQISSSETLPFVSFLFKEGINVSKGIGSVIDNCGIIYFPKLVKEYESKTDVMGIDLGTTRCVLAVSRNKEIQIIPIDNSSPGDLWTESVVSFNQEKPIIGKGAVRRLKTKPDHVVMDYKLLCDGYCFSQRTNYRGKLWRFQFNLKDGKQPYFTANTSKGQNIFSLAEINAIFLQRMKEAASQYQIEFNRGKLVNKAVITIPQYCRNERQQFSIESVFEAARMAGIEVIDIIEETHADLLYYLAHERYSELVKLGMRVAIFDIGGGTGLCRIYKFIQQNDKIIGIICGFIECAFSGRDFDDKIMQAIEDLVRDRYGYDLSRFRLRLLEEAKRIKHDLSLLEEIE